jgi:hypothetical protein
LASESFAEASRYFRKQTLIKPFKETQRWREETIYSITQKLKEINLKKAVTLIEMLTRIQLFTQLSKLHFQKATLFQMAIACLEADRAYSLLTGITAHFAKPVFTLRSLK